MDAILQTFFSWQFLTFGVGVSAIVFVLRKFAEYLMANVSWASKESKLWNDLLLPISPVFIGSLGALALASFPYPEGLTSLGGRFVFGLVAGLLSTLLYRIARAFLFSKLKEFGGSADESLPNPVSDVKEVINDIKQASDK